MLVLSSIVALVPLMVVAATTIDTVLNDITVLDGDVKNLIAGTAAYEGGFLGQGPLLLDLIQVHLATQKGAFDTMQLPNQLSTTDAESLINLVNETLSVDNPIAVMTLESKKPLFQAQGSDPFIKAGLQILLNDHLDFSNAALQRIPSPLIPQANQVIDVITDALENGISDFSN